MTIQEIYDLIGRFEASTLHTMKVTLGEDSLELCKGGAPAPVGEITAPVTTAPAPASQPVKAEQPSIEAPLVGTYYAASAPDAAPFVSVGDLVKKGQTVCLIEAMKMISEIPAPCDCMITEILKTNGSLVGFHEPLFHYKPC